MPKNQDADIELAQKKAQVASIRRKERIQSASDYIEFVTSKLAGVTALVIGSFEYVDPNILPLHISSPERFVAFGLMLLVGKQILTVISKTANVLKS